MWDETLENPALAFVAAQLVPPRFPTPLGVFRGVDMPTYESRVVEQMRAETERAAKTGDASLEGLLRSGDVWTVHADGSIA